MNNPSHQDGNQHPANPAEQEKPAETRPDAPPPAETRKAERSLSQAEIDALLKSMGVG